MITRNPFPGLRPFSGAEEHLFFGREYQVDSMVDKLASSRFLAVVGPSGSGKSSLVNCGLQPALHRGLLASSANSWKIAKLRPGRDPMRSMARALAGDGFLLKDFGGGISLEEVVDTHLRMSKRGLLELYTRARLTEQPNLLIIVDQFEELFRYSSLSGTSDGTAATDAVAFVNLLLEPSTQQSQPIYVAITMRSDFLGDCAQFFGLPDAINSGQYLVPRMSREQRRRAIRGPVGVAGAEISPVLLTRLVNDVGDNPDQLSILQHALNRTWAGWSDPGEGPIELRHYEKTGSMAAALDNHAELSYLKLATDRQRLICEKLFKSISDTGTDARGIRRPTLLSDICAIANADIKEVTEVIEVFRDPDSSFLTPPPPEDLEPETVIDISHESLMRIWKRLIIWTAEEAENAERYRRLARTAALQKQGNAELAGAELELMLKWRDDIQPNAAWGERYHPGFDEANTFLSDSKSAAEERKQKALKEMQEAQDLQRTLEKEKLAAKRRKFVYTALGFIVLAAVLSAAVTSALLKQKTAENDQLLKLQNELKGALNEAEKRAAALTAASEAQSRAQASEQDKRLQLDRLEELIGEGKTEEEVEKQRQKLRTAEALAEKEEQEAKQEKANAALAAVGGRILEMDQISTSDLFDVTQGATVLSTSGAAQEDNLFGKSGKGWAEGDVTFFADNRPANYEHWIEWRTKKPLTIGSVHLFAIHDGIVEGYRYRRGINKFRLFVMNNGQWDQLIAYSPTLPYGGVAPGREPEVGLAVCLSVQKEISGNKYRAEFLQAVDILGQFSGPRIVELDGFERSCET